MSNHSLRGAYAKHILGQHLRTKWHEEGGLPKKRIPMPHELGSVGPPVLKGPICIVGAGAAGLAIAFYLSLMGIKEFDILEATDRVGGRCYTYRFNDGPKIPHDYYDIGAMRIPEIPGMQP
jgi:NADPH-dependent 2,4-dienoyl-CoA reductase/sulfur reductase-like enzyme